MTLAEKFWARVERSDGCWNWTGYLMPSGYGRLVAGGRKNATTHFAHRLAYELLVGPIPAGLEIDHLCSNRACVNPKHLEAVDHRTNLLRGQTIVGINARKTHCPQGHPYDDENTIQDSGKRKCRACRRAYDRQRGSGNRRKQVAA